MRGWQANKKRTCAPPIVLGLCPKMKYHPLRGWIFIVAVFVSLCFVVAVFCALRFGSSGRIAKLQDLHRVGTGVSTVR